MTDAPSNAPSKPRAAPSPLFSARRLALVVALTTATAWVPSLANGFVWDDQYDILRSDRLHHARAIFDVFVHHAMWSADQPETEISTYRPLALATIAIDWRLWHTRAAGYHATNVLMHVLAVLALFLALMRIVDDERTAAVLALLFALHPANAEAVAWINGRSEMIALGFGALALWAARTRRPLVVAIALVAAMLGKETGVVFVPVAIALADGKRARTIIAAAVALAIYASLRSYALGHTTLPHGAGALATLGPVWSRATVAALVPWRRAPIELLTWVSSRTPHARSAWALAGAALAAAVLVLAARRRWLAAIGLGWWLIALAPTAAIAALDYPWPGLGRWLYVGLPGLLLVVWLAVRRLPPPARVAVAAVTAVLFVVGAERSIRTWHDDESLYAAMVAETPDDAWAWRALGTVRLGAARYADAADCFHRAVTFDRTAEVHAAYALEAYAWAYLDRCDAADAQFRAHPLTPALSAEAFDAALTACRARVGQRR
jgi:protein O-mannosyl-transferase